MSQCWMRRPEWPKRGRLAVAFYELLERNAIDKNRFRDFDIL